MEQVRGPLQGVGNIVRFNWHFYLYAVGASLLLLGLASLVPTMLRPYAYGLVAAIVATTAISLLVSFYIYDVSGLYSLAWLPQVPDTVVGTVVNIHAGFDETSALVRQRFHGHELIVLDFYDPSKHTEVSIRRARATYPPFPGTKHAQTHQLPVQDASAKWVFIIMAAHEVRQPEERIAFLEEVRRITRPDGKIVVIEHLRDTANFLAYTIGFLHFYSRQTWHKAFEAASLTVEQEKKVTPFVSVFFLAGRGISA